MRKSRLQELAVLYDEGCGFCTSIAAWLGRRPGLTAVPIGSDMGARLLRDLAADERYDSVHVVDDLARRRSAGAAMPPLLRTLPGGAAPAALLDAFPWVAERGYRLVSDHRVVAGSVLRMLRRTVGAAA